MASPQLQHRSQPRQEPQAEAGQGDSVGAAARQCPFLLTRIREVEQDLEAYGKTRAELNSMLEQQQDELVRSETLENLDFCDSNIKSLNAELQELRGETAAALEIRVWEVLALSLCHRGPGRCGNWFLLFPSEF